ncbi:SPOR domain-containing protein [Arcobacteraceae bacterium]|nr:SPOR domain-containing protein [Arcobacteraceae bacterium]
MKVDGKEFLRNVGIEQDKERLTQEQQKLEELKRASVQREQNYTDMDAQENEKESAFVDLSIGSDSPKENLNNNVEDIVLNSSTSDENKKKYLILGIGLILLFIITILVIRLISNGDTEDKLEDINNAKTEVVKEDILNKIDSNEEYQKVIDRKIALEESNKIAQQQKKEMNEILIPEQKIDNVPLVLNTPKTQVKEKRDLFELDKTVQKVIYKKDVEPIVSPKIVKKVVKEEPKKITKSTIPKRTIVLPPAKEKNFTKNVNSLSGYFVQIGAFTKAPNKNLLKDITKKGYSYTVYQLVIKGKLYNKVLIGSYKTRSNALGKLNKIKSDFNNPNAYVLKF